MRVLVAEDDLTSRILLQTILSAHAQCDVVVDGEEAVKAFRMAWEAEAPYDLVCLDIMMPRLDGQQALQQIRESEREMGVTEDREVKVIMTTALGDAKNLVDALYTGGAASYLVKPVSKKQLLDEVRKLGLME